MERVNVSSTSLESVGYDPETQVLEVEFKTGRVYRYLNVPAEVHRDLLLSESHGEFFNEQIRDQYSFERVE